MLEDKSNLRVEDLFLRQPSWQRKKEWHMRWVGKRQRHKSCPRYEGNEWPAGFQNSARSGWLLSPQFLLRRYMLLSWNHKSVLDNEPPLLQRWALSCDCSSTFQNLQRQGTEPKEEDDNERMRESKSWLITWNWILFRYRQPTLETPVLQT